MRTYVRTISVVLIAMRKRESCRANCLLRRSPIQPKMMPPSGRAKKAAPNTEKVSMSWASSLAGGKKAAPVLEVVRRLGVCGVGAVCRQSDQKRAEEREGFDTTTRTDLLGE